MKISKRGKKLIGITFGLFLGIFIAELILSRDIYSAVLYGMVGGAVSILLSILGVDKIIKNKMY